MSGPTKSHAFSIKKELMSSGPGALFPSHSHIAVLNSSIETGISKREDELRLNLLKLITEHEGLKILSLAFKFLKETTTSCLISEGLVIIPP
jgi:hypothetical protein